METGYKYSEGNVQVQQYKINSVTPESFLDQGEECWRRNGKRAVHNVLL